MEIVISIAAKITECTVGPILRGARTIINPQIIIQETQEKQKRLQERCDEVNDLCKQAKLDGHEIKDNVNRWLNTSQVLMSDVEQWFQNSVNQTNNTSICTKIRTSKWIWAHKQRRNAIQNKDKLWGKIIEGEKLSNNVSYLTPTVGTNLLSGTGFTKFDSVNVALDAIMKFLRNQQGGMFGIHGMGGVGKTSLVKQASEDAEVEKLFSKVVVTVLSQAPNIHKIQAQLGEQLSLTYSSDESESVRARQLMTRMKYEDTILVVLDDVWREIDLASIGIPFGNDHPGCKVILTTRYEPVCLEMGCKVSIPLVPLTKSESWELFKSHAGNALRDPCEFKEVAEKVADECGKLPLALIVVASALQDKHKEDWESALNKLKYSRLTDLENIGDTVYACIKLSYDFLKAEITKRCFLMCSLFPEDYEIILKDLTDYALGYGLFDYDNYSSAKREVKITIRNLVACNLLIRTDSVSEGSKMHDVVRDAALWITSKGEDVFLVPISLQTNWKRDRKLVDATAISLLSCPMNQHLPSIIECPRLKMLLMAQGIPLQKSIIDTCFNNLTALQVLDMTAVSKYPIELELPSSLNCLHNLQTLYLRRWILKGEMSIIGSFTSLQILSFSGSVIDNLPVELIALSELMSVDLSGCKAREGFNSDVIMHFVIKVAEFHPPGEQISKLTFDGE